MTIEIKNLYTNQTIYTGEGESLSAVVQKAVAERAYLRGANLTDADLAGANLTDADLIGADLTDADLAGANLTYANLTRANLTGADLAGANLTYANLTRADLTGANLTGANLAGADLAGANLTRAYPTRANLTGANLTGANLAGADLAGANLTRAYPTRANLTGAKGLEQFRICPEGSIVGWKKIDSGQILCLEIPASAKRLNAIGSRKCRAEYAVVIGVFDSKRKPVTNYGRLTSRRNSEFIYNIGEEVQPDKFDEDIRVECSNGIHFFITFEEARDY